MKRAVLVVLCTLFIMPGLWGHGVHHSIERDSAIIVNAMYHDHKPIAHAEVKIYMPEENKVEYQNGRTDKNGRFAFYPHTKGEWTVVVRDAMGHGFTEKVNVSSIGDIGHTHGGLSVTQKVIMAICVVWGFAGFYFYFKGKQSA